MIGHHSDKDIQKITSNHSHRSSNDQNLLGKSVVEKMERDNESKEDYTTSRMHINLTSIEKLDWEENNGSFDDQKREEIVIVDKTPSQ